MTEGAANGASRDVPALRARTVAEAFRITAAERPADVAVRTRDDALTLTWGELRERVDALAGGLMGLGLRRGQAFALMLGNRPEFHVSDLAGMMLGAASFSIYNSSTSEQLRYLVADSGARILICQQEFLPQVLEARRDLPGLEHVIVIDAEPREGVLSLAEVEAMNAGFDVEASVSRIEASDLLTLIYTSGTTGPPKGVELTHRNMMAAAANLTPLLEFPRDGRVVSWLPSAHIAERNAHHYFPALCGLEITCCRDPREIISYLPEVRPSWFFAVPRIWEKMKANLEAAIAALPDGRREEVEVAIEAAGRKVRLEQHGEKVPVELGEQVALADAEIFRGLRKQLGLDRANTISAGGAPTPVDVLEFFHAIGLPLAELWGMSETCGIGTLNPRDRVKIGTVGPAVPGVELKIDADGEVLVRSDMVMLGYRNMPEQTRDALAEDGWLRTGDIGTIDEDGYLSIVDRKKELIISAGGKNMSPANIEAALKGSSPLIGQAVCIGDRRPFNTALIVLDADIAPVWAANEGIEDVSLASLSGQGRVRAAVQEGVDAANAKLARVEQIKKFTILAGDWPADGDELTPTMKLKRKPIAEKYRTEIEEMYSRT